MPGKNALVLLANNNYLEYTKPMFYSARKYGNWRGDLVLLAYEIPDNDRLNWFRERGIKIEHINRDTFHFENIPQDKSVYFAKLDLFHPKWNHYDKIVYLDTDMLIRKDINNLLNYNHFAAADDCFQYPLIHQFSPPGKSYEKAEINNHYSQKILKKISFNTGVMVIHSAKNGEKQYRKLIELTEKFGKHSVFYDQGVLNLYFIENRSRIPYVYNDYFISEHFNRRGLLRRSDDRDAVILHIIHPYKPWDKQCIYHREWNRRAEAALTEKLPPPQGDKPSQFSIWKIDLINLISIKEIYFRGAVVRQFRYNVWRTGRFFRHHLPSLHRLTKKKR